MYSYFQDWLFSVNLQKHHAFYPMSNYTHSILAFFITRAYCIQYIYVELEKLFVQLFANDTSFNKEINYLCYFTTEKFK